MDLSISRSYALFTLTVKKPSVTRRKMVAFSIGRPDVVSILFAVGLAIRPANGENVAGMVYFSASSWIFFVDAAVSVNIPCGEAVCIFLVSIVIFRGLSMLFFMLNILHSSK